MGKKLFEEEAAADDEEKITIDEEFARRYEHNNRRADLHRLKELEKNDLAPDSDTEESESEVELSGDNEEFFDKLNKVKNRDPSIYRNKDARLFDSDNGAENNNKKKEKTKTKNKKKAAPVYLKDVQSQQLLEDGPQGRDDNDHDHGHAGKDRRTYLKEQEELMKAFRDVEEESVLDGDLLKEVDDGGNGRDDGEDENGELEKKVGEYFGEEGELDEKKRFLRDYFLHKMWDDKDMDQGVDQGEVEAVIEDEYELERLDRFEEAICFRHEENAGDRVMGHSRVVEGSVRKKDNPRKEQRLRREERMKIAEKEKKEELKRLKNLKKQEIAGRMKKIMDAAGIKGQDCPLDLDLENDDDFDPEEHDKKMSKAFDDKYYEDEDSEFGSDMEKPDFDEEDRLLGLPEGVDFPGSDECFSAAGERILKTNAEKEAEKAKKEMLEEYYKLDCEGFIGDLKTRFKYREVQPNRYGMKPVDILLLDEKELNQYVSMKKIAVYRENEWKLPNSKRHQLKMRASEVLRGLETDQKMVDNKKRKRKVSKDGKDKSTEATPSSQDERAKSGEPNPDEGSQSTQAKRRRRRRQEELKMAPARRYAYTQAQPKPKSEGKH